MPRKCALLVEPDEATCTALKAMLEGLGFDVVTMSDGESAVSVFNYVEADVVLTSFPFGKRAGENLLMHIRKYSPRPGTPILALIQGTQRLRAREALSDGCDDTVLKPVEEVLLARKLRALLGESPGEERPRENDASSPEPG